MQLATHFHLIICYAWCLPSSLDKNTQIANRSNVTYAVGLSTLLRTEQVVCVARSALAMLVTGVADEATNKTRGGFPNPSRGRRGDDHCNDAQQSQDAPNLSNGPPSEMWDEDLLVVLELPTRGGLINVPTPCNRSHPSRQTPPTTNTTGDSRAYESPKVQALPSAQVLLRAGRGLTLRGLATRSLMPRRRKFSLLSTHVLS